MFFKLAVLSTSGRLVSPTPMQTAVPKTEKFFLQVPAEVSLFGMSNNESALMLENENHGAGVAGSWATWNTQIPYQGAESQLHFPSTASTLNEVAL